MNRKIAILDLMAMMVALFAPAFGQQVSSQKGLLFPLLVTRSNKHLFPTNKTIKASSLRAVEPGIITFEHNKNAGDLICIDAGIPDDQMEGLQFDHEIPDPDSYTRKLRYYKPVGNKVVLRGTAEHAIISLFAENCGITSLDVSQCPSLEELLIYRNPDLTTLDCSQNKNLETLGAGLTGISSVKLANLKKLSVMSVAPAKLEEIDLSGCDALQFVLLFGNKLKGEKMTKLFNDLPSRTASGVEEGWIFIVGDNPARYQEGNICLMSDVKIAKEKHWLVKNEDRQDYKGHDYVASLSDDQITFTTSVPSQGAINMRIKGVDGADFSVDGAKFWQYSSERDEYVLDKSTVTIKGKVGYLDLSECQITSLDVSGNKELEVLLCANNPALQSLDLREHTKLKQVDISGCPISSMPLKKSKDLVSFKALSSKLLKLDVEAEKLETLHCSNTLLLKVDLAKYPNLKDLILVGCRLAQLDLSQNKQLREVQLQGNELEK